MEIDRYDLIAALGGLFLLLGVYLGLGMAPALGFLGALLLIVGVMGAIRRGL